MYWFPMYISSIYEFSTYMYTYYIGSDLQFNAMVFGVEALNLFCPISSPICGGGIFVRQQCFDVE